MRTAIVILTLALMVGAAPAHAQETKECSETELNAGTVLKDGTVAGEKQALTYFREHEPVLHKKLTALEPHQMRERFGRFFAPFQRVGRCRQRQKQEMVKQLNAEIRLKEISETFTKADDQKAAELKAEAKDLAQARVDSETALMEYELDGLRQSDEQLQAEIGALDKKIQSRKQNREKLVTEQVDSSLQRR
jgi:hypothetical protein